MFKFPVLQNQESQAELERLFSLLGIAATYIDNDGNSVAVNLPDRIAIMQLMGCDFADHQQLLACISRIELESVRRLVPKTLVVRLGQHCPVTLQIPPELIEHDFCWSISNSSSPTLNGKLDLARLEKSPDHSGADNLEYLWQLPELAMGYHELVLTVDSKSWNCLLLVAPESCYAPSRLGEEEKLAGLSVQVYTLKSARNWGIGDFGDLQQLLQFSAAAGLDFLAINPLHALNLLDPEQCSPYSPHDRRFINPLYLALESEQDFRTSKQIGRYIDRPEIRKLLQELRSSSFIDYARVAELKQQSLIMMFEHFHREELKNDSERAQEFQLWQQELGTALAEFCSYEAARHSEFKDCRSNPTYHAYLQWLCELQLLSCQRLAEDCGMVLGLIRDLAVGSHFDSAERQLNQDLFCESASIGAPPDSFAPQGQDWSLVPLDPRALENSGFDHFIELLKRNMAHCGALRIDHVMSLMRLWWCIKDEQVGRGGYVHYPVAELFAILRIESQRNHCLIIGEDLGVVPPEIHGHMHGSGVLGSAVLYFEKYDSIFFKQPQDFPGSSLTMISNHDVPTLPAWWNKTDLELRWQLGLFSDASALDQARSARESDLIQILHWLNDQALLPDSWQDFNIHRAFDCDLFAAILRAVGGSTSILVALPLDDLCMVESPVNIPGTSDEYPNWRRKMPVTIEDLRTSPQTQRLLEDFTAPRA